MEGNEKEVYRKLVEKYFSLSEHTGKSLNMCRKWFVHEVISHYDMVEVGILYFGEMAVDVESIYFDDEKRLMLHISCKEMEGDIYYSSLQEEKQGDVVKLVFEEMKRIEEGPTLMGMMIGRNNILYRSVYIRKLKAEVKVTSEEVFSAHIKEGSPDDDKFYCYAPPKEFYFLNDQEFEEYINKNY